MKYLGLDSDLSITSPNTVITSTNEEHHKSLMNNEKVQGFSSSYKTIHYMPHGLNQVFSNLITIRIAFSQMKEIHQKDLEQFPKLRFLSLISNDIEYLEKDLFKFNPQLQIINLSKNEISQIYPTVINHLNQLERLWLYENQCVNNDKEDRTGVLDLIKEIKKTCIPFTFDF